MSPFRPSRLLPAFLLLFASQVWACAECDCDDDKPAASAPAQVKAEPAPPAKTPAKQKAGTDAGKAAPVAKTSTNQTPS